MANASQKWLLQDLSRLCGTVKPVPQVVSHQRCISVKMADMHKQRMSLDWSSIYEQNCYRFHCTYIPKDCLFCVKITGCWFQRKHATRMMYRFLYISITVWFYDETIMTLSVHDWNFFKCLLKWIEYVCTWYTTVYIYVQVYMCIVGPDNECFVKGENPKWNE